MPLKRKGGDVGNRSPAKKIFRQVDNFIPLSSNIEVLIACDVYGQKYFIYKSFIYTESVSFSEYVLTKCECATCPSWGIIIRNVFYVCNFHNHEADTFSTQMQIFLIMLEQLSRQCPRYTPERIFKTALMKTNLKGKMFSLPPIFRNAMLCARKIPYIYKPALYKCHAVPVDIESKTDNPTPEVILKMFQADIYKNPRVNSLKVPINNNAASSQTFQSIRSFKSPEDLQRYLNSTSPDGSKTLLYLQNSDLQPRETVVLDTPECVENAMRSCEGQNPLILNYARPDVVGSFVKIYNSIHKPGDLENLAVAGPSSGARGISYEESDDSNGVGSSLLKQIPENNDITEDNTTKRLMDLDHSVCDTSFATVNKENKLIFQSTTVEESTPTSIYDASLSTLNQIDVSNQTLNLSKEISSITEQNATFPQINTNENMMDVGNVDYGESTRNIENPIWFSTLKRDERDLVKESNNTLTTDGDLNKFYITYMCN